MYRIMFIDDEENILKSVLRTLRHKEEWEIETYTSPLDALKRLHCCIFDVVISDHNMPDMNGVTFLTELKEIQPDAMRILLTGMIESNVLLGALNEASVFRFITKPWNDEMLIDCINNAIEYRNIIIENKMLAQQLREHKEEIDQLKAFKNNFSLHSVSSSNFKER